MTQGQGGRGSSALRGKEGVGRMPGPAERKPRGQWVLLAVATVVVAALAVHGAGSANVFAEQRSLASVQRQVHQLQAENRALAGEARMLRNPVEIANLAHREFGLVFPGEKAYQIMPGAPSPRSLVVQPPPGATTA